MSELHKPAVAILASGSGSTAEAFILATVAGRVDAEVPVVISNNEHPGVFDKVRFLNRAHKLGIETLCISSRHYPRRFGEVASRGQTLWQSEMICEALDGRRVEHVGLMGYMEVVTGDLLDTYGYLPEYTDIHQGRMSNTHPGPLPLTVDTFGIHASEKVLETGRKYSAYTVHLVAAGVDQGPVIARHRVKVEPGDTPQELFQRVQVVEKKMLPIDIDRFLKEQAAWCANS